MEHYWYFMDVFVVFIATFKNISVISWWNPEYQGETSELSQFTDKLYHIMLYRVQLTWEGFELTTLEAIGTDCIVSCKSNYHTITTTRYFMRRVSTSLNLFSKFFLGVWMLQTILDFNTFPSITYSLQWKEGNLLTSMFTDSSLFYFILLPIIIFFNVHPFKIWFYNSHECIS
jgi:hypothetical protein